MESLLNYLFRIGVLENGTDKEIEKAKEDYRKFYVKEKQKVFRENHIRKEIILTPNEYAVLLREAQKRKIKLAPFIRKSCLCYINQHFLLPSDNRLQELCLEIRKIGNGCNQLVRYFHRKRGLSEKDLNELRKMLNQLEDRISHALRQPKTLDQYLKNLLQNHPEYLKNLEQIVSKSKAQNDNKDKLP